MSSQFLKRLAEVFDATKDKRSVWITHKRCARLSQAMILVILVSTSLGTLVAVTYDGGDTTMVGPPQERDNREYPCVLKVTDGQNFKMSAHVRPFAPA